MTAQFTQATQGGLSIREVAKRFQNREVLRGISLDVRAGEFLTILGESGSGKTTLLRLIAGFEQADGGEIWLNETRLDTLPPYRRPVNTVFQSYALFPHLSVFENVAYGLRVRGVVKAHVPAMVDQALAMVKMSDFASSAPARLSGGQQQRVALARALVNQPQVLLLDEPLSALDANLRRQMQHELKSLQREVGITFVFVTHDQEEAMALSDRVALLRAGHLEQVASPREIYARPATAYTAQFIGQTNLLQAEVCDGRATWSGLSWTVSRGDGSGTGSGLGSAFFSLRPEAVRIASAHGVKPNGELVRFRARLKNQTFGGATDLLEIAMTDGRTLRVRVPSNLSVSDSEEAEFEFAAEDAVFVRETK
jgi:ABC-type Fe3+/spermidine/putrescine transport system ATPase subunit